MKTYSNFVVIRNKYAHLVRTSLHGRRSESAHMSSRGHGLTLSKNTKSKKLVIGNNNNHTINCIQTFLTLVAQKILSSLFYNVINVVIPT